MIIPALRKRPLGLLLSAVLWLSSSARAEPVPSNSIPPALSLQAAAARALAANPELASAQAGVAVAEAEKRAAFAAVLPRLGITGGLTHNSKEVGFGSGKDRRTVLPLNDWNARLTLTQPLYAGFRDIYGFKQARQEVSRAGESVRAAEESLLFDVATQYLAAVEASELFSVETKNRELAERRKKLAEDLFAAGEVTRLDVLRGESAIQASTRRWMEAEQQKGTALSRLRIALALEGELAVTNPGDFLPPLADREKLLAQAAGESAELKSAQLNLEIAELDVKRARGAYFPVVGLQGTVVEQKSGFPTSSYSQVALLAQIPLFSGGETRAQVTAARERARQAELYVEATRRRVREGVETALLEHDTAVATLELARQQLAVAEAEYEQTFALYQAQEATSLDLDAAEVSLAAARRDLVSAGIRKTLAELGVRYTTNTLKATLLPEVTR